MKQFLKNGVLKTNALKLLFALDKLQSVGMDGITSRDLISFLNSDQFLDVIGSNNKLSEGSVYGTLSRLRSKGLVKKLLKETDRGDDLIYKITGNGQKHLNSNLSGIREQISKIDDFKPNIVPA